MTKRPRVDRGDADAWQSRFPPAQTDLEDPSETFLRALVQRELQDSDLTTVSGEEGLSQCHATPSPALIASNCSFALGPLAPLTYFGGG